MDRQGGVRRALRWLALAGIVALAVPMLARATGIETGVLMVLVSLTPWVTLACVVPLALALLARAWVLAGVAAVMLGVGVYWIAPLYVNGGGGGEPDVTVATVNMTVGGADAQAVVALARDHSVDLLSVQELTPEAAAALTAAGLDHLMPYSEVRAEPGITGTALYSTLPLSDAFELDGYFSGQIGATVAGPDGDFTMFAVHPMSPGARNHDAWSTEMRQLVRDLDAVSGPVIVAGDFNTTRDHRAFRDIEALGYEDAADRIDAGFRPTFPQNRELFPFVAIDHVLTRDVLLRPATFATQAIPGADHRALIVGYTRSGGA